MKKLFVTLLALTLVTACKKKDDKEPEPAPAPPPSIFVKVDGVEKQCSGCYSGSKSGGMGSSYFYLSGFNEQIYISHIAKPTTGTYNLVKFQDPMLIYIKDNVYYRAVSGTFNITSIDTSKNGVVNKMVGTFNFKTDTTGGKFFNITEGAINLN